LTTQSVEAILHIENYIQELISRDDSLYNELSLQIIRIVDTKLMKKINYGIYDSFVSLNEIKNDESLSIFRNRFLKDLEKTHSEINTNKNFLFHFFINGLIKQLVNERVIVYVYDKQRIRTRIAEMIFYLVNLKQRFHLDNINYEYEPSLVQMVKFFPLARKSPKRDKPYSNAKKFLLRRIPALEKNAQYDKIFSNEILSQNLNNLELMLKSENKTNLAKFQVNAFTTLFRSAVELKRIDKDEVYIIAAGTGAGKTEGFLLPIILYCLSFKEEKRSLGTSALLLYPRIDLCNNQLERLVRYLHKLLLLDIEMKKPIKVAIQHSKTHKIKFKCPYEGCSGFVHAKKTNTTIPPYEILECEEDPENHVFKNINLGKWTSADIIITTPDSLHRRLMDVEGNNYIWRKKLQPKFVVLDEAHIYTGQSGVHVMNVIKRLKRMLKENNNDSTPIFIASSATIGKEDDAKEFANKLFSTFSAEMFTPKEEDLVEIGREYIIMLKAVNPKKVRLPKYTSRKNYFKKLNELSDEESSFTFASNLSCMIQTAFCFYHTMKKDCDKRKILGFVDSIDIIKRLGDKLYSADTKRLLYQIRNPIIKTQMIGSRKDPFNFACPYYSELLNQQDNFNSTTIPCAYIPPNPQLTPCKNYNDGECWWLMDNPIDLNRINVQIHKSGQTKKLNKNEDDWDLMITTSALEVGFDDDNIIGTFQYMSPNNIPGFIQRKGRGGRKATDMPINIIVFGSRPNDDFFFQHPSLLVDPDPSRLKIPLDTDNVYINTQHMITSIFDVINRKIVDKKKIHKVYKEVDMGIVQDICNDTFPDLNSNDIKNWLQDTFNIKIELADDIFDNFKLYVDSCNELFGREIKFFELIRFIKNKHTRRHILDSVRELKLILERVKYQDRLG